MFSVQVSVMLYLGNWTSMLVTYEFITAGGPLPMYVPMFWSVFSAYQTLLAIQCRHCMTRKHCYNSYIL